MEGARVAGNAVEVEGAPELAVVVAVRRVALRQAVIVVAILQQHSRRVWRAHRVEQRIPELDVALRAAAVDLEAAEAER